MLYTSHLLDPVHELYRRYSELDMEHQDEMFDRDEMSVAPDLRIVFQLGWRRHEHAGSGTIGYSASTG